MSNVVVAVATEADREACFRLAYDVFYTELGTMADAVDHERRWVRDEMIDAAHLLCAKVDGEVVGCLAILLGSDGPFPAIFEESFGIGRYTAAAPVEQMAINLRFLVREDHRSTMLPLTLIRETTRFQRERGVELSFADCQPHLLTLYEAIGFRAAGPTFDQPGFGLMVPLLIIAGDREHLEAIGSPLRNEASGSARSTEVAAIVRTLLPGGPAFDAGPDTDPGDVWADSYAMLTQTTGGLFDGLETDDVERLLAASHVIQCSAGQKIVVEAQGTRTMFIVLEGNVDVRTDQGVKARLGPGQPFGEVAYLLGSKRTADVVAASTSVRVVALDQRVVNGLITSDPALAATVFMNLARALALRVVRNAPASVGTS